MNEETKLTEGKTFIFPDIELVVEPTDNLTDIYGEAPDQPIGDLDYDPNCEW